MSYESFVYDTALMVDTTPSVKKAIAKVEFRPLPDLKYNGEFGFDWFRVGDNGEKSFAEAATQTTGGVAKVLTPIKDIQKDYKKITVLKSSTPVNILDGTYYVPYLNLYTKGRANTVKNGEKPPFEAKLQIKITIDEELEKVEFEYDKTFFSISFGGAVQDTLPDTVLTPCAKRDSSIMKISCYNEKYDGFSLNKELKVWAYPKGSTDIADKKLVGKIIIGANDRNHRKFEKMVVVKVRTDIENSGSGNPSAGATVDELICLRRSLYQSLTFMDTEFYPGILNLTGNNDFKIVGTNFGRFIYERGVTPIDPSMSLAETTGRRLFEDHPDFFSTLRTLFLDEPGNSKYSDYFTVFYFKEYTYDSFVTPTDWATTLGQVEDIGTKNLCIFQDRDDWTLAHEALHGYGLHHPFISYSKHLFDEEATDNIMDYGSAHRPFTWAWQWKIVNPKLKI